MDKYNSHPHTDIIYVTYVLYLGTVQLCFPSLLSMGQRVPYLTMTTQPGQYISMGKPVKHRRNGRQKVWQAFRICDIVLPDVPVSNNNGGSSSKNGSGSSGGSSDVAEPLIVKIEVICGPSSLSHTTTTTTTTTTSSASTTEESTAISTTLLSPAVAIHAIDTSPLYFGQTNGAYGNHLKDARIQLVSPTYITHYKYPYAPTTINNSSTPIISHIIHLITYHLYYQVAYGGATGLLRVHAVDLKKEIFR